MNVTLMCGKLKNVNVFYKKKYIQIKTLKINTRDKDWK